MKYYIQNLLGKIAKAVLEKYKPKVIAITGSVGKTSTREAIFAVVSQKYEARTNIKNYNNEFGLPFTILNVDSPKRNPIKWLGLFFKAMRLMYSHQPYPEVLVLEMGIDKPGDMDYLRSIVRPDVAVLTAIGISHIEFFKTHETVLREKKKIFKHFEPENVAILNFDDEKVLSILPELKSKVLTYGKGPGANIHVKNHRTVFSTSQKMYGVEFDVEVKGEHVKVFISSKVGIPHVMSCAAGVAVGVSLNMSLGEIQKGLENYKPQPGRLAVIPGKHHSVIIDDTYNSAPNSALVAIQELEDFPGTNKIAVMGDMLELGHLTEESHLEVGNALAHSGIDHFVLVGKHSKAIEKTLSSERIPADRVHWFKNSTDAISHVEGLLSRHHKSIVLVKGSQGVRMEKIVRAVMADQSQAAWLLCRQDPSWLKK